MEERDMEPITLGAVIERLASVDGDEARAKRQLADALDALRWEVKASYTPPEVMQLAVTIGRAELPRAQALPPSEDRELLLGVLPALDELEALAKAGRA
jgi:DNA-directed RNA polymerase alpha subunit